MSGLFGAPSLLDEEQRADFTADRIQDAIDGLRASPPYKLDHGADVIEHLRQENERLRTEVAELNSVLGRR